MADLSEEQRREGKRDRRRRRRRSGRQRRHQAGTQVSNEASIRQDLDHVGKKRLGQDIGPSELRQEKLGLMNPTPHLTKLAIIDLVDQPIPFEGIDASQAGLGLRMEEEDRQQIGEIGLEAGEVPDWIEFHHDVAECPITGPKIEPIEGQCIDLQSTQKSRHVSPAPELDFDPKAPR